MVIHIDLIDQNNIKIVACPNVTFSIELKHIDQTIARISIHLIVIVGSIDNGRRMFISIHRLEGSVGNNLAANSKKKDSFKRGDCGDQHFHCLLF